MPGFKRLLRPALFGLLLATLMVPSGFARAEKPIVGAYLWGGMLQGAEGTDRFHKSLKFLLDQGFQAVRFTVSSSTLRELGLDRVSCGQPRRIGCYLEKALADPVFDDQRIKLLMITLHEFGSQEALSRGVDGDRAREVETEFRQAVDILQRRFAGRPVRIVISNWEGDNMVYCGAVFGYMRNASKARACDSQDGNGIQRRLTNFLDWMKLRDAVVQAARARHPDFNIAHAPEFNVANLRTQQCVTSCDATKTVFETLARAGQRPLCSYSSYNSATRGQLQQDLPRLLRTCQQLILGELGFPERRGNETVRSGFATAAAAIAQQQDKIPAVIIWNAFNVPGVTRDNSYGLFRQDGSRGNIDNLPAELQPGR